ncbi:hypothetical protein GQ600_2772 [Phytophthora cactorum]|nr:hypothetical protein GQ600_2772 [Phytophthora cactorum]
MGAANAKSVEKESKTARRRSRRRRPRQRPQTSRRASEELKCAMKVVDMRKTMLKWFGWTQI